MASVEGPDSISSTQYQACSHRMCLVDEMCSADWKVSAIAPKPTLNVTPILATSPSFMPRRLPFTWLPELIQID